MSSDLITSVNNLTTQATELLEEYSNTKEAIDKTHQAAISAKDTAQALFSIKHVDGSGQNTLRLTAEHFLGNQILTVDTAAGITTTIVIPNGLGVSQPLMIVRLGDGPVALAGTTSVKLLHSTNGNSLPTKNSVASILPVGENQYLLVGELWRMATDSYPDVV